MKYLFFISVCLLWGQVTAQEVAQPNIIPNPSFERFSSPPIGWFYKGEHYTNVMKYWSSATNASPDVFGPKVRVPAHWEKKGFGKQMPRSGHAMSGITVYGCEEGKPHCREYIQIQLSEPLVVGQDYLAEMWVTHLPNSLRCNNLGFHFSTSKIDEITDGVLLLEAHAKADMILESNAQKWVKVSERFVASSEAEYVVIGNFFPDSLTQIKPGPEGSLPFAYYYIDDVLVKKMPPILPIPIPEDDLSNIQLEAGKSVPLRDIYFEHDESELMPRSFVELKKLLKIMRDNPSLAIEICGHTDNTGKYEYNRELSEKRAKAVSEYLISNGIPTDRTSFRGCGSAQPIATNATPQGRQLNRRVEFVVLQNE